MKKVIIKNRTQKRTMEKATPEQAFEYSKQIISGLQDALADEMNFEQDVDAIEQYTDDIEDWTVIRDYLETGTVGYAIDYYDTLDTESREPPYAYLSNNQQADAFCALFGYVDED